MDAAVYIVIGLVLTGFLSYVFLMVFYPEWVGITGPVARKNLKEHEEGSKSDDIGMLR